MTAPILRITDGTESIDLIGSDGASGFFLPEWMPQVAGYKNDGVWQDSSLADGRALAMRRFASVVETFTLHALGTSQDALIRYIQDLRRLLEKAADYWTTEWQDEPVWLEARGPCETNTRYALVSAGRIAEDKNPYQQPFFSAQGVAVFDTLTLVIEREPFWRHLQPGQSECVPLSAVECFCEPHYIECDGDTTVLSCGNPAKLIDLPDNAVAGNGPITVESWIRADSYGEFESGVICSKGDFSTVGWAFYLRGAPPVIFGLAGRINAAGGAGYSYSGTDEFFPDSTWHHVVMTYDETGAGTPVARLIYLAIDGVWVTSYQTQQVSAGNYASDAAVNMAIGNIAAGTRGFDGGIGWTRVSDNIRYVVGANFTPPPRCALPPPDANTMWLGIYEGAGNTVYDLSATPSNGTLSNGTWDCDCDLCYGNVLGDCGPAYLEFNGDTSDVNCGSGASIDNLPSGANGVTIEAWIRPVTVGENNEGRIADKREPGSAGWRFYITTNDVLVGQCDAGTQDAFTSSPNGTITLGQWQHVAMTYEDTVNRRVRLWVDGQETLPYATSNPAIGAYTGDAALSLMLGNRVGATRCFDGDIGWMRISDTVQYTMAFTPPERCALPPVDANTVLAVIYEGVGATTYDRSGNANDGAITACTWGCDCYLVSAYSGLTLSGVTREPTCDDEVYFGNRNNEGNITNVHFYDSVAGTWSANIQAGALPAPLLPGAPAAGDVIVFVADSTLVDANPFCSMIFDLLQVQTDLEITWRYSQGGIDPTAWPALTVQDNTNYDAATGVEGDEPFTRTGVHGVFWEQPSNWENNRNPTIGGAALGVTGYAVAAHVTAVGANPAPPIQQNRDIYSVTWSYVEMQSADVLGDVLALGRALIRAKSDSGIDTAQPPSLWFNRLIISGRGYDRGGDYFRAFLQASDTATWNDTNLVRCYPLVSAAFVADPTTPTGRAVALTNPAAAWNGVIEWRINQAITQYYRGKYRAFLRVDQTSGVANDLQFRIRVSNRSPGLGYAYPVFLGDVVTLDSIQPWATVDLGIISIPPSDELVSGEISSSIIVQCSGNGASDCTIYDLVIMPIDEICVECVTVPFLVRPNAAGHQDGFVSQKLEVDSITLPKHDRRSFISNDDPRGTYADVMVSGWNTIGADPFSLQANSRHRLYFLAFRWDEIVLWTSPSWITNSAQLYSVNRYLSMRGGR